MTDHLQERISEEETAARPRALRREVPVTPDSVRAEPNWQNYSDRRAVGLMPSRDQTKRTLASHEEESGLCPKQTSVLQMKKLKIREVRVQSQMASIYLSKNRKVAPAR